MDDDVDVYQSLADELQDYLAVKQTGTGRDIVDWLDNRGVLDYDVLKEIYLYLEEEY